MDRVVLGGASNGASNSVPGYSPGTLFDAPNVGRVVVYIPGRPAIAYLKQVALPSTLTVIDAVTGTVVATDNLAAAAIICLDEVHSQIILFEDTSTTYTSSFRPLIIDAATGVVLKRDAERLGVSSFLALDGRRGITYITIVDSAPGGVSGLVAFDTHTGAETRILLTHGSVSGPSALDPMTGRLYFFTQSYGTDFKLKMLLHSVDSSGKVDTLGEVAQRPVAMTCDPVSPQLLAISDNAMDMNHTQNGLPPPIPQASLIALDATSGRLLHATPLGTFTPLALRVADAHVFILTDDGRVIMCNARTGRKLATSPAGISSLTSYWSSATPTLLAVDVEAHRVVAAGTSSNTVSLFDSRTGQPVSVQG